MWTRIMTVYIMEVTIRKDGSDWQDHYKATTRALGLTGLLIPGVGTRSSTQVITNKI